MSVLQKISDESLDALIELNDEDRDGIFEALLELKELRSSISQFVAEISAAENTEILGQMTMVAVHRFITRCSNFNVAIDQR